ncbi:MAG: hypothetical protein R3D60_08655 [Paracoccaceae bacterium]
MTTSAPTTLSARTTRAATVPTDGYETYVTQHNGFTRVRRSELQPGDAAIVAQFEDSNPASPAGFRSLVDPQSAAVRNRVFVEIIGQDDSWIDGGGNPVSALQRVLRLTADVEDFNPAAVASAGGQIVLSGSDYSVAQIGTGRPNFANQSDSGSLWMSLDFDNQTATVRIINRTLYYHTPQSTPQTMFLVDLLGENMPFNIETGAFGGEVNGEVYQLMVHLGGRAADVSGTLLGTVGGAARDDLVAGGVFEASGTMNFQGQTLDVGVDGVFWASN